jgi:ribosome maturation protein SDO1
MLIDPGQFRVINEILQKECKGRGRIETLTFAATAAATA